MLDRSQPRWKIPLSQVSIGVQLVKQHLDSHLRPPLLLFSSLFRPS